MADNGHKRKDKVKEKKKMGIFDRFKVLTVNDAINESRTDKNAVLIDIRAKDVYKRGYISGSINIPMTQLELKNVFRIRRKRFISLEAMIMNRKRQQKN